MSLQVRGCCVLDLRITHSPMRARTIFCYNLAEQRTSIVLGIVTTFSHGLVLRAERPHKRRGSSVHEPRTWASGFQLKFTSYSSIYFIN